MSTERSRYPKLDEGIQRRVDELCAEGDLLAAEKKYDEAVIAYTRAFAHLPMPVVRWHAANRILTAISDALFLKGDYVGASEYLTKVMLTPGASENSFIRLRRGQTAFERGSFSNAEQELAAVYVIEGEQAFKGEDPKYLAFIESKILSPEA